MKTLVVAEKPSVAGDIARALGGFKREKDYFENEQYVVSSAVGHLLEIVPPEGAEVKRGKWSLTNLPVAPDHFDLQPIKASQDRLRALARLYKRKDIGAVINACDAGREGELIFYYLICYLSGAKEGKKANNLTADKMKPVQRLWLSSMTPTAIRRGFDELRENSEVENLRRAAVCRNEADWLIGINSTRAMTALFSAKSGFDLRTVGRVQTPTLAILVERDRQIKAFKPEQYWELHAEFDVAAGTYPGVWVHDKKTIAENKENKAFRPERVFSREQADAILAACRDRTGQATETVKPASEIAPMLFDLTSLQRESNARFGMSARGVLATAQSLYERHKLITYPRTDSRCLPQDYPPVVKRTLETLRGDPQLGDFASTVLNNNWVVGANKRLFNDAKVSDHFAIIPTGHKRDKPPNLKDNERKIYDFICRRFIAAFYPPAKYLVTERRTMIDEHCFLTKGRVLKEAGWRAVAAQLSKDTDLVAIAEGGEEAKVASLESEEKTTQPPPYYSEATLLSAMEGAGKMVEDEELRDAMSERGLGTPATRASIIEGLVSTRYIVRDRRDLIPTPRAHSLMRLLAWLNVEDLTQPSLTGQWEQKLRHIENAEFSDKQFREEIKRRAEKIIEEAKNCGDVDELESDDFTTLKAPCPQCGGIVAERFRHFTCQKCGFFVWKDKSGREFSVEEVERLLTEGTTGELEGFRSRLGREFSAEVKLSREEEKDDKKATDAQDKLEEKDEQSNGTGMLRAVFAFQQQDEPSQLNAADLADKAIIGPCPKCGANVRDTEGKYLCEAAVGEAARCDFSFARRILQRDIQTEQLKRLLTEGKTGLIDNFISRKNRRPFKAYLKMDLSNKEAKLEFEFEARKPAKKAAKRKAATKPKKD